MYYEEFLEKYPDLDWQDGLIDELHKQGIKTIGSVDDLMEKLIQLCEEESHIIFMSNGSFENAPRRFLTELKSLC